MEYAKLFGALFVLLSLQAAGTYLQVQQYKRAVRRMHKFGNVGIGGAKGGFRPGSIVVIACDRHGKITGGEIMEGISIFSSFKELSGIKGRTVNELHKEYEAQPPSSRKKYRAHLKALEALQARLCSERATFDSCTNAVSQL